MGNIFGDMPGKMDTERDKWMLQITRNGEVTATVSLNGYDLKEPEARSALVDEVISELGASFVRQIAEAHAE